MVEALTDPDTSTGFRLDNNQEIADLNVQVEGDNSLSGADCAEDFDVCDGDALEHGTVLVINNNGILEPSGRAYDKRVAGVISGAGSHKTGIVLDKQPSEENRKPIALIGKVNCKVDARYSPVEVGDLLTTSPTPWLCHEGRASEGVWVGHREGVA
jgi:hypothetical protein